MTADRLAAAAHRLVRKPLMGGGGHTPGVGWMCTGCEWRFSYDEPEKRALEVWGKDQRHADRAADDTLRDELAEALADYDQNEYSTASYGYQADALLPMMLGYADAQVAAERKRIIGSIDVAIALRDKAGGNTQDLEICRDIARGQP